MAIGLPRLKAISIKPSIKDCLSRWNKGAGGTVTLLFLGAILNVVSFLAFFALSEGYRYVYEPPLVSIGCEILLMVFIIFEKHHRYEKKEYWLFKSILLLKKVVWVVLLITIIIKVINLGSGTINHPMFLGEGVVELSFTNRIIYVIISVVNVFYDSGVLSLTWSFKTNLSSTLFSFSFILQLVLGMTGLQATARNIMIEEEKLGKFNTLYLFVNAFIISGSLLGFVITITMANQSRFNPIIRNLVNFLVFYEIVIAILTLISFGTSANFLQKYSEFSNTLSILFGCSFFINLGTIWSSRNILIKVPGELCAEEINLKDLKPYQKKAYAMLISSNTRSNPGVSGEEIISLMEAYNSVNLKNLNSAVLRIYNPRKSVSPNNTVVHKRLSKYLQGYDEKYFFENIEEDTSDQVLKSLKPISKNQRKREMKKAAKAKKVSVNEAELFSSNFEEESAFYNELASTEALVFLTQVDNYDLTSSIPGYAGKVLSKCFGAKSWSKLLCIRCGILGFHWPFRRAVYFCSSSKNPTLRNALLMMAVSKYNNSQKKKCTILIDPMYRNSISEKSIQLSKWVSITLPNSNIIDLRPHKGKKPKQYFKDIKYRVQADSFASKGGIAVIEMEPNVRSCADAYHLWSNISLARENKGKSGYFVNPDQRFFESLLENSNNNSSRSLLFLKINGVVIASCLLFRLGNTITSDLQGLDYANGKKYSPYFVMMEKVIEIALEEGISYVDFGPTTDDPKQSIGALPVQLEGAIYTPIPFISGFIKFAAGKVNI